MHTRNAYDTSDAHAHAGAAGLQRAMQVTSSSTCTHIHTAKSSRQAECWCLRPGRHASPVTDHSESQGKAACCRHCWQPHTCPSYACPGHMLMPMLLLYACSYASAYCLRRCLPRSPAVVLQAPRPPAGVPWHGPAATHAHTGYTPSHIRSPRCLCMQTHTKRYCLLSSLLPVLQVAACCSSVSQREDASWVQHALGGYDDQPSKRHAPVAPGLLAVILRTFLLQLLAPPSTTSSICHLGSTQQVAV